MTWDSQLFKSREFQFLLGQKKIWKYGTSQEKKKENQEMSQKMPQIVF